MTYAYDPELVDIIAFLPELDIRDLSAVRVKMNNFVRMVNKKVQFDYLKIEDITVAANGEWPAVNVRVYQPLVKTGCATQQAALLYLHGGGFVMGSLESEHASVGALAEQLGIIIVSVDYRLAPEHPYPAALHDTYAALQWLHQKADYFNIDTQRIGVMGVSAGGCLAAALTLMTRDRNGPPLCFQLLDMPVLDEQLQTASMKRFHDTPLWNYPSAVLSWKYYLGALHGQEAIPYLAAPARASDLRKLPNAYICAMEFDPLRDEAIHYANQLMAAGISVELHCFPGTYHGSSAVIQARISQRQHAEKIEALRKGLAIQV